MKGFQFDPLAFPAEAQDVRRRVRAFLEAERDSGGYVPHENSWTTWSVDFSRRAGKAGFLGMTWPREYGGHERSAVERYVVTEEMLAASAPCFAHWVADRQTGPQILRFGSERAKRLYLPRMAAGTCFSAIGMSEPDSGSDLAGVRTRADRTEGGWLLNGSKIWTSNAHRADVLLAIVRTATVAGDRHAGLTQFIVDTAQPGLTARPILNIGGIHEFNEVHFENYFVPDDMVLGEPGDGWAMVTSELSYERSGPDRFLSDYWLLVELIDRVGPTPDRRDAVEIGRLVSQLSALRRMSTSVAGLLDRGGDPQTEAAVVKEVGTAFEQELPEVARRLVESQPSPDSPDPFDRKLAETILYAPAYTIRGGTREIMRGMIARSLGLR